MTLASTRSSCIPKTMPSRGMERDVYTLLICLYKVCTVHIAVAARGSGVVYYLGGYP